MQHHPWILPWGVPLQKMVAVPLHPAAAHPHHHHPGIPQPLHPHHHHPHPATVHVPAGVLGLPPAPLAALRTFVTATQVASVPATPRPRKVGSIKCHALLHRTTRFHIVRWGITFQVCDGDVYLFGRDMVKTKTSTEIVVDATTVCSKCRQKRITCWCY